MYTGWKDKPQRFAAMTETNLGGFGKRYHHNKCKNCAHFQECRDIKNVRPESKYCHWPENIKNFQVACDCPCPKILLGPSGYFCGICYGVIKHLKYEKKLKSSEAKERGNRDLSTDQSIISKDLSGYALPNIPGTGPLIILK